MISDMELEKEREAEKESVFNQTIKLEKVK